MGVLDIQKYIEENVKDASKPVDLIKLARGLALSSMGKRKGPNRLCLVVDGESCLDRLYGGFYSDWACGGQWNRMNQFLGTLIDTCAAAHMELVVFFNGSFESSRTHEWCAQQQIVRKNASQVLKHITNKATPPPKVWWIPPVTLRSSLRMALRQWGVPVASSLEDHHQEVIAYCRENMYHGIVADESDYVIFDPPRYFSSQHLKLTYKGALDTTEFVLEDVAKGLGIDKKQFAVMAALLGTHLLSEEDLEDFHFKICNVSEANELKKLNPVDIIKAVAEFVRLQENIHDLDAVGKEVFGSETHKINKFRQTVRYYLNGTEEFFNKHKKEVRVQARSNQHGARLNGSNGSGKRDSFRKPTEERIDWDGEKAKPATGEERSSPNGDKIEGELSSENPYIQHESGYGAPAGEDKAEDGEADGADGDGDIDAVADKVKDVDIKDGDADDASAASGEKPSTDETKEKKKLERKERTRNKRDGAQKHTYKLSQDAVKIARERHSKGIMHPWVCQILQQREIKVDCILEDENSRELPSSTDLYRPIRQSVYAILFDYNKRMLIYRNHLKEVKGEEKKQGAQKEGAKDSAKDTTKPAATTVAIGCAIQSAQSAGPTAHGSGLEKPSVTVKEWIVPRGSSAAKCNEVSATELEWLVPGLHKLWFGQMVEDKNRRLRAFLSALHSDVPLMLNTAFVPQHLIVLCAVLRYIVKFRDQRVLRKHELDAFLCTAVSPLIRNVDTMQEMKLPALTARGVQLGSLFMRGVEHAMFVNDACGAPVPWGMTCPWNFFDGKLFHFKLLKANNTQSLIDICDGQMDQVMRVERLRSAVLQDVPLDLVFAKPPLHSMAPQHGPGGPMGHPHGGPQGGQFMPPGVNMRPAGAPPGRGVGRGGPNGHGHSGQVDSRGGQLQIAGVVISNWGPNIQGKSQGRGGGGGQGRGGDAPPPQVTSVGPRRGRGGVVSSPAARGRGMPGRQGAMRGAAVSTRGGQGSRPAYGGNMGSSMGGNMYNSGSPQQQQQRGGMPPQGGQGGHSYQHQGPPQQGGYGPQGPGGPGGYPQRGSSGGRGGYMGGVHNGGRGGLQSTRGSGRGGPGGSGQKSAGLKHVTLEQRNKSPSGGRGRGCTVETQQDGSNVVSVSQLMKEQSLQYSQQASAAAAAAAHIQQQQQQQQMQQAAAAAHSVASHVAASQAAHHQAHHHMLQSQHHMTQVSMSQHLPPHMSIAQSPGQQMGAGGHSTQMSLAQQQLASSLGGGHMSQAGGHISVPAGLLTQMANMQSNMAAITAAELSAQMGGGLNGQDFSQYGAADLSGLGHTGHDLQGMMNHAEFTMHHMGGPGQSAERMGMFDMGGEQN